MPKTSQKSVARVKEPVKKTVAPVKYSKINAVKFGLAAGILTAICIALTTIAGIYGHFLDYNAIILSIYGSFGYSLSYVGALIGLIYGFIDGFVIAWLFAVLYNILIRKSCC